MRPARATWGRRRLFEACGATTAFALVGPPPPRSGATPLRDGIATGRACFSADIRLPGLRYAVIARPPTETCELVAFDAVGTLAVPGVVAATWVASPGGIPLRFPLLGGVAVVATNTWAALKGRDALKVTWRRAEAASSGRLHEGQQTRPQTVGTGLADSPAAQAAWIHEKFNDWTDNEGGPETLLSADEMLDNIMLYWLPNAGASSARLYWEVAQAPREVAPVDLPVAFSRSPADIGGPSRRWAERRFRRLVRWNEVERGGHFAAFEQPGSFIDEVRAGLHAVADAYGRAPGPRA